MKSDYAFVLDCSVTMAWCFKEEASDHSDQILDALHKAKAIVPSIWPLEVGNVLTIAERKKRLTLLKITAFIDSLSLLPIQVDFISSQRALGNILELAREQGLSTYDAAYLELAMRKALPLATFDKVLKKAAQNVGIELC